MIFAPQIICCVFFVVLLMYHVCMDVDIVLKVEFKMLFGFMGFFSLSFLIV